MRHVGRPRLPCLGGQTGQSVPCSFIKPSGQDPEQSGGAEKPQTSLSSSWNLQALGRKGRNEEETEEK